MSWRMKPVSAEGASQGLEILRAPEIPRSARPALVLVDAQMPEIDGFALVEKMKADPQLKDIAVIMLTSAGLRGDAARCRELDINAYLSKPIKQSDLLECIKRALGSVENPEEPQPLMTVHSLRESRSGLEILLAEDNAVNQKLAVRLLEKRGHRVVVAETGTAALEALTKRSFDLVLMDVQMPEMDGLEATALIREGEKKTGKHIPVIAMTANAMVGDKERCLQAGMDGYVSKPIQSKELFGVIEAVMRGPVELSPV